MPLTSSSAFSRSVNTAFEPARKGEGRTGKVDLSDEVGHALGHTASREEVGEGMQAVDDFGEVLGVVKVERFEAKDLQGPPSAAFSPILPSDSPRAGRRLRRSGRR